MRLIDADAYAYSGDLVNEPTIDAAPVVRCKDCRFCYTMECALDWAVYKITEDSFCSKGERRADIEKES